MDGIRLFVWNLNAELLYEVLAMANSVSKQNAYTSSIAMTTSTVSRLSRPRSFEKCDVLESFDLVISKIA